MESGDGEAAAGEEEQEETVAIDDSEMEVASDGGKEKMVNLSADKLKSPAMLANAMIGGSTVVFILSTLMATVVFDQPSANSTIADQEIELAMQVFPTEQHIKVWMDAVIPLHIVADIMNITKIYPDGSEEPGGLVDLFPVGDPATGKGKILFKIASAERSEMPDLKNRTQEVIPMAFIKSETFSPFVQSFLKFGAVNLNNIGLIVGMAVIAAIGMIVGGVALLYLDKKKTPVITVVD